MAEPEVPLRRVLSLPLLTLYGVGTIVGAGFYALLGEVAGLAGTAAPSSILIAGLVASFTALSFAALAARYPESGGPVRYVEAAFGAPRLARATGLLMIFTGVVSAATLARATAGFLDRLYGVPPAVPIAALVVALTCVAGVGVRTSGLVAAGITVLEVGVLALIPFVQIDVLPDVAGRVAELLPGDHAPWPGALAGSFLVFYAFVGFEDMVTLAEEVHEPRRNLPRAILAALVVTTLLYVAVAAVAVVAVPPSALAEDAAPLALLVGEAHPRLTSAVVWVGVLAGLNGALVQIMMAARVIHGMRASSGANTWLGAVHARTRTPLRATIAVGTVVLALALWLPLVTLVSSTSAVLLVVFALVNAALFALGPGDPGSGLRCPRWVPATGCALTLALLATEVTRAVTS